MTEQSYQPQINLTALDPDAKQRWVVRMLFTAAVLGAVVVVVVYHSWFRSLVPGALNETSVSTSETAQTSAQNGPAKSKRTTVKRRGDAVVHTASQEQLIETNGITQAALRSPSSVEVISGGGQHQMVPTQDDAINLGSRDSSASDRTIPASDVFPDKGASNGAGQSGAEQVRISSGTVELASPASGNPAVLAKQSAVEGAVVLLARIDKDGNIQNIQVISGPQILFAAAREAVKQWRFKPHYNSGQAVATETQITVKFAISAH
jgi:TonB family protein